MHQFIVIALNLFSEGKDVFQVSPPPPSLDRKKINVNALINHGTCLVFNHRADAGRMVSAAYKQNPWIPHGCPGHMSPRILTLK